MDRTGGVGQCEAYVCGEYGTLELSSEDYNCDAYSECGVSIMLLQFKNRSILNRLIRRSGVASMAKHVYIAYAMYRYKR